MKCPKALDTEPFLGDKALRWVERYREPTQPVERVKIMQELASNEDLDVVVSVYQQIHESLLSDIKIMRKQ